jgi:AraC-like DNA-binding protein
MISTELDGSMMGAHFKPGGAQAFFGMRAGDFQDNVVEWESVWGNRARDCRDQLLETRGIDGRFATLERFLCSLLAEEAPSRQRRHEQLAWAAQRLSHEAHVLKIGAVAEQLGMSHKHFVSQFEAQVGLTPKLFCRLRRFQQLVEQLQHSAKVDWADLAVACGYYDQSHLVRDCQSFAGLTPTGLTTNGLLDSRFLPVEEDR